LKLIFCPKCQDVVKLWLKDKPRYCKCRKSYGHYIDNLYAEIGGLAIPIGFANSSFAKALENRPKEGMGYNFTAFVIPEDVETISKIED
jgi:hypothetical protein